VAIRITHTLHQPDGGDGRVERHRPVAWKHWLATHLIPSESSTGLSVCSREGRALTTLGLASGNEPRACASCRQPLDGSSAVDVEVQKFSDLRNHLVGNPVSCALSSLLHMQRECDPTRYVPPGHTPSFPGLTRQGSCSSRRGCIATSMARWAYMT
jgi:hypothetical protein